MDKKQAIRIIDSLYPIDSEFENTNEVGRELLARAKKEVGEAYDWRNESEAVLIRYAELCQLREFSETRKLHTELLKQDWQTTD